MKKRCNVPGCHRPARTYEMCNAHYARYRRSGSPLGKQVMRDSVSVICSVKGCSKPYKAKGLCSTHYERMRRNGTLKSRGKRLVGEGTIKSGYVVYVRHLNGKKIRIRRCRLVMEKVTGRKLLSSETVHHKNGNKLDDNPKNLELWCNVHPKGQRVSDLIKYARYILKTYVRGYR